MPISCTSARYWLPIRAEVTDMPFVKGRYVPESEMQPAAENEQEQNKPAVREKKRAKGKRFGKKEAPAPELTPEELEAQRLEEERKILRILRSLICLSKRKKRRKKAHGANERGR